MRGGRHEAVSAEEKIKGEEMKETVRFTITLGLAAGIALASQDTPPAAPMPPEPPAPAAMPAPRAVRVRPVPRAGVSVAPLAVLPAPAPFDGPVPPTPPAAPAPAAAPQVMYLEPGQNMDPQQMRDIARDAAQQARDRGQEARDRAQQQRDQMQQQRDQMRDMQQQVRDEIRAAAQVNVDVHVPNFNLDMSRAMAPMALFQQGRMRYDNSLYGRGQAALDDHKYDQALDDFNEVVVRGQSNADGALYWKAYTLNKLGRRDDSLAAIGQLRTQYASSHWLDDAKALELEVKQATGPVSPDSQSDDELKLMALNGLSQTDPARAYPAIDKLLKGPASPALKKRALYVLAANSSPEAQKLLEQIARGSSNPDLQLNAIRYMVQNKQFPNRSQVLFEIYNSTSDTATKREIIGALQQNNDNDHLVQIYRSEKNNDLRRSAINALGEHNGNAELWQLYQAEQTPEARVWIVNAMKTNGNLEKLVDVARNDKDPKVRQKAVEIISTYRGENLGETLASLYSSEQDAAVKRQILGVMSSRHDAKALVSLFHKESNFEMKKSILNHLQNMHTAEANELYMEILSK
jgi:hypothetical protein